MTATTTIELTVAQAWKRIVANIRAKYPQGDVKVASSEVWIDEAEGYCKCEYIVTRKDFSSVREMYCNWADVLEMRIDHFWYFPISRGEVIESERAVEQGFPAVQCPMHDHARIEAAPVRVIQRFEYDLKRGLFSRWLSE